MLTFLQLRTNAKSATSFVNTAIQYAKLEEAAEILLSSDYVQLTKANMSDVFRRMKGY